MRVPGIATAGGAERQWGRLSEVGGLWWRVLRIAYLRFGFSAGYIFAAAIALYAVVCLAPLGILLAAG